MCFIKCSRCLCCCPAPSSGCGLSSRREKEPRVLTEPSILPTPRLLLLSPGSEASGGGRMLAGGMTGKGVPPPHCPSFPATVREEFYTRSLPSHLPSPSQARSALQPAGKIHGLHSSWAVPGTQALLLPLLRSLDPLALGDFLEYKQSLWSNCSSTL